MKTPDVHTQVNEAKGLAHEAATPGGGMKQFDDRRPSAIAQRKMIAMMQGRSSDPVVQRDIAWKDDNHPNNTLDAFADALNTIVQAGAAAALTPEDLAGLDGYTALWKTTAPLVMALRDENIDDDDRASAQLASRFAPARYGYAVEAYANERRGELEDALPDGYTVAIQAGRGMTRPDFVVSDNEGHEVGWFDITSAGSLGHIDKKSGGGWKNKTYVAEITYPALDINSLTTSDSGIGQRVRSRNMAIRIRQQWQAHIQDYQNKFLISYDHYKTMSGDSETKANKKEWAKDALSVRFFHHVVKDKMAKSLLRALELNPAAYGFDAGGSKAEGETVLRDYLE